MFDEDLTMSETAQLYKVSIRTVRRWVASGQVKAYRLPGNRLIRIEVDSLDQIRTAIRHGGGRR